MKLKLGALNKDDKLVEELEDELYMLEFWNSGPDWFYTRQQKSEYIQKRNKLKQQIRRKNGNSN